MCSIRRVFVLKFHGHTSAVCRWVRSISKKLARVVGIASSVSYKPMQYSSPLSFATSLAPLSEVTHTLTQPNSQQRRKGECQANKQLNMQESSIGVQCGPRGAGMLEIHSGRTEFHRPAPRWLSDTRQRGLIAWSTSEPSTSLRSLLCNLNTPHTSFPWKSRFHGLTTLITYSVKYRENSSAFILIT